MRTFGDQARLRQLSNGLSHGRARDPEPRCQSTFLEGVTRCQLSVENIAFDSKSDRIGLSGIAIHHDPVLALAGASTPISSG